MGTPISHRRYYNRAEGPPMLPTYTLANNAIGDDCKQSPEFCFYTAPISEVERGWDPQLKDRLNEIVIHREQIRDMATWLVDNDDRGYIASLVRKNGDKIDDTLRSFRLHFLGLYTCLGVLLCFLVAILVLDDHTLKGIHGLLIKDL